MREALRAAPAPVVAVSPIVGGAVLKGPTAAFMDWAGLHARRRRHRGGVRRARDGGLLDAILADERRAGGVAAGVPVTLAPTLMADAEQRREVAARRRSQLARGGAAMSVVVVLPVKELDARQAAPRRERRRARGAASRSRRGC